MRHLAILLLCGLVSGEVAAAQRGTVYDRVPSTFNPRSYYLIYLHGRIIEDRGRRPTHETWGTYEYQQILDTLAAEGIVVISEQRPPNTDSDKFAAHVADQLRRLLAAGVPPERIAVVGFSKGGGIAMRTSALLEDSRLTFVFLAACGDGDFSKSTTVVRGRILSLFEASDEVGQSCAQLLAKSGAGTTHSEIEIRIGGGHGAFFRPKDEWVVPVLRWVRRME